MPCLQAGDGDVVLRVRVVPGARKSRVVGLLGDELKIAVTAAPEKGRANAAVLELLASALGLPTRRLELLSGATSRRKRIRITAISPADAARLLTSTLP